jgi:2-hydroxy-6-oxonona-2,4-dienedioate hydrolase
MNQVEGGFADSDGARIYYETAGQGTPLIMIHAGVADSRQWNNEFVHFSDAYRVIRYDLRGFGRSEPVDAEYSHMRDLVALMAHLGVEEPVIMMGCSMGGTLAMDYTLAHPAAVKALIMVDSGPSGLQLDVPPHPAASDAEAAYNRGDLDRVAELETQIWFDGMGRTPDQVDGDMRRLAYEMNRLALSHDSRHLGEQLADTDSKAADRVEELQGPVLIVVGEHDIPYIHAAADYMQSRIPSASVVVIDDAAHLPNLDHPDEFQRVVAGFLGTI